jgi:hypothetical protein
MPWNGKVTVYMHLVFIMLLKILTFFKTNSDDGKHLFLNIINILSSGSLTFYLFCTKHASWRGFFSSYFPLKIVSLKLLDTVRTDKKKMYFSLISVILFSNKDKPFVYWLIKLFLDVIATFYDLQFQISQYNTLHNKLILI